MYYISTLKLFLGFISENKITQVSASLAYYLTMTFFPCIIVVYSLLGNDLDALYKIVEFADSLLPNDMLGIVREYLLYIDTEHRSLMLPLGGILLLSYASAALRSFYSSIGKVQGGTDTSGIRSFVESIFYSVILLALFYLLLLSITFGRGLAEKIICLLPGGSFVLRQGIMRYFILFAMVFSSLLLLYHLPKRKHDDYKICFGACLSAGGIVSISPCFSYFIENSIKYSLVYGSMASIILLMFWLYLCCLVICTGGVFNIFLYKVKKP